jgi:ubiquinone/menaquinone biosynthesis C-methylase UbiE
MTTIAARYDRHAEAYDRYWAPVLAPTAIGLLDEVTVALAGSPPDRILDIGTGTGTLVKTAAGRWPAARIVGVDGSTGMLAAARRGASAALPSAALGRIEWQAALAERLPFQDGSFDLVVSSFVLQLVLDRPAALREARRVVRPGGMLGVVTWLDDATDFEPEVAFEAALDELDLGDDGDEAEEARSGDPVSAAALAAQLRRAGFVAVRARAGTLVHRWDVAGYLDFLEGYDAADLFATLPPDDRSRLRAATARRLAGLGERAFEWRTPVVRALARRPG